ncbi:MAG TPA: hypothetical protein VN554_03330 [Verrucomicrobiae bacterium]|nr:hypothetical protein [Verrucomicrobiae bacterium]
MSEIPGENIDTASYRGRHPENSPAWSAWIFGRLPEMRMLRNAGLNASRKNKWRNVVEHSIVVNAASVFLARKLAAAGADIDLDTVEKASLLHDATKRRDKEKKISYGSEKRSFQLRDYLEQAGYAGKVIAAAEGTGRVIEMYGSRDTQPEAIERLSWEELIVAYVDARTRNTDLVSLEVALYGDESQGIEGNIQKIPSDAAFYEEKWYPYFKLVEERIFGAVDDPAFTPESLNNEAVIAMIHADTQA